MNFASFVAFQVISCYSSGVWLCIGRMADKKLPSSVISFLTGIGAGPQAEAGLDDLPGLVRAFREAAPDPDSNPFSQQNLSYLTALLDCIGVMDERLYEHYRALIDLFREGVFRAPREKLLAYPSWNELRDKGVRLGLLSPDLYGKKLPQPHLGVPEVFARIKEGLRK